MPSDIEWTPSPSVIDPTGETDTAVPVQKTSSELYNSFSVMSVSIISSPNLSWVIFNTESRVTPARILPLNCGVINFLSFIMNKFAEPTSSKNVSSFASKYSTSS